MLAELIGEDVGSNKDLMEELKHFQIYQAPSLLHLFGSFLRLGTTAFGGPAMVGWTYLFEWNRLGAGNSRAYRNYSNLRRLSVMRVLGSYHWNGDFIDCIVNQFFSLPIQS
jgi:hypothetical protein